MSGSVVPEQQDDRCRLCRAARFAWLWFWVGVAVVLCAQFFVTIFEHPWWIPAGNLFATIGALRISIMFDTFARLARRRRSGPQGKHRQ